ATRMSFLLWATTPDDGLLDTAAEGALRDPAVRESIAREMLDDVRARDGVARIYTQWFGAAGAAHLTRDATLFPDFDETIGAAMEREVAESAAEIVLSEGAGLDALLNSGNSRVTAELAAYYGVQPSGSPDADGLYDIVLPAAERSGLLTRAGVMARLAHADQTAPVLRGRYVREAILCQPMPEPPADVDDTVPPVDDATTVRERFEQHRADAQCAACHELLDPVGFGFEHYDGAGRYRSMEGAVAVDASGTLTATDVDGEFNGAIELSARLSESAEVQRCAVLQHATVAFGRAPQASTVDACWVDQLQTEFEQSDDSLSELLVAVVTRDNFAMRKVAAAPEEN
ncbi:MAG: DUF1588 domain-containing protein, partial [Myxococcota bacterium]